MTEAFSLTQISRQAFLLNTLCVAILVSSSSALVVHRSFNHRNVSPLLMVQKSNANLLNENQAAVVDAPSFEMNDKVSNDTNDSYVNAFSTVAWYMAECLYRSDVKKDALYNQIVDSSASNNTTRIISNTASTTAKGAGNWVDDASAYALRSVINSLEIELPSERPRGLDRDEAGNWLRWMKAVPEPLVVELSHYLRDAVDSIFMGDDNINNMSGDETFKMLRTTKKEWLDRLGCRLILMPSGSELKQPLRVPNGGLAFGKLLYGGAKRFRLLPAGKNRPKRRTSEVVATKVKVDDSIPCWINYGGPDRKYEALDMGSCAVIEFIILPKGETMPSLFTNQRHDDMALSQIVWSPFQMFKLFSNADEETVGLNSRKALYKEDDATNSAVGLSGKERNEAFETSFTSSIGGLRPQIEMIVRRVLDGRILKPAEEELENEDDWSPNNDLAQASLEADALEALGLTPVRGLLLYGPPGCGKTALAREISKCLRARAPKIISTPELLDRWVGGSEKLVRSLFAEAEAELTAVGGDVRKSALHVIVLDEIDAVFRKRTSASDSGEATRSSVVNQILAKLDGVKAIPNVLLIGMTNRRELLDEALLRPGRLEVQIEIPLPDKEGRREILFIHTDALRKMGRLSQPLCDAIDGIRSNVSEEAIEQTPKSKRHRFLNFFSHFRRSKQDLAAITKGYSGADIAGLVRCAGSIALARARQNGSGVDGLLITLEDFNEAYKELSIP